MALPLVNRRWVLKPVDTNKVDVLQKTLNIHPVLCRLLVLRGIDTYEQAKQFFRPELTMLHDPFLMKGMKEAVARITEAVEWHERILVYGDYDVDGTTAVAVMYSFLKKKGDTHVSYYIPHRYREGYGVSRQGIDFAIDNGFSLVITLDCGIKSAALVAYAKTKGIDVIVCDHHTPGDDLPPALAILNPKQSDCPYPYKELSGCGIGFKLISALAKAWNLPESSYTQYLDLVATSIAADIVPVDGENRLLAYFGIANANDQPSLPIRTLKDISGINKRICLSDLVFAIGPKINAAGRMDDARKAVDMFIEEDPERIVALAAELMSDNDDRKEVDRSITEEAMGLLESDTQLSAKVSTVLYRDTWHKGVVGIVASRLLDYCYRPTIILTGSSGKISGSARSVHGFNIYEALCECADLLENYGGHFYAAGVTLKEGKYDEFVRRFEEVVARRIDRRLLTPEITIDADILLEDIKPQFYNIMKQFAPFGPANMKPVFRTRAVWDYQNNTRIVKEQHIKFSVHNRRGIIMEGIGFRLADKFSYTQAGPFDIVYTLDENDFNGNTTLQMRVIDILPAQ